jgi:hypothetical protein
MAITTPVYCSREDVKSATDMQGTTYNNAQIDRAIQEAARNIDGHLHLRFYPEDKSLYFDWPAQSGQGGGFVTYPWKLYFDGNVCLSISAVESPPGTALTLSYFNLEPYNYGPPYTYIEIQRDKSAAFGGAPSPQRSVKITGTWGYTNDQDSAGTLAAAISSTSATSLTVSDASLAGVGNILTIDSERMIVQDRSTVTSNQTNVSGATTGLDNDNAITVTDGTQLHAGEVILIDAEKMLITDITVNQLTVKRAYDGTTLATHSTSTTIYVYRVLSVLRGVLGTTAATHLISAPVSKLRVPFLIRNLTIAEAVNIILQETGGYSNPQGEELAAIHGLGTALADKWDEARTSYGRKSRMRTV